MTANELKEKIKSKKYKMSKSMQKMIERMNITKKRVETKNPNISIEVKKSCKDKIRTCIFQLENECFTIKLPN